MCFSHVLLFTFISRKFIVSLTNCMHCAFYQNFTVFCCSFSSLFWERVNTKQINISCSKNVCFIINNEQFNSSFHKICKQICFSGVKDGHRYFYQCKGHNFNLITEKVTNSKSSPKTTKRQFIGNHVFVDIL